MAIIKGRLGAVYLASIGAGTTTFTDEAMTANVAKTVYHITDPAKRFWDPASAVVVKYNAGAVTDYASIQYPGGAVTWAVTPGNSAVTCSGKYLAVAAVGEVKGFTLDIAQEFVDTTTLGDTMRENTPVFRGATVTVDRFYVDSTYFTEMTTAARIRCGFDLFVNYDAGTPANDLRYTGYGVIASKSISTPVDGIIDEPLTITVIDGPYYMVGLA
jgi:hypothetical protein